MTKRELATQGGTTAGAVTPGSMARRHVPLRRLPASSQFRLSAGLRGHGSAHCRRNRPRAQHQRQPAPNAHTSHRARHIASSGTIGPPLMASPPQSAQTARVTASTIGTPAGSVSWSRDGGPIDAFGIDSLGQRHIGRAILQVAAVPNTPFGRVDVSRRAVGIEGDPM